MAQIADRDTALRCWQQWVDEEIGGGPDRIKAAIQAAVAALDMGKDSGETAAAARKAAAEWDSRQVKPALSSNHAIQQWQRWVEQQIGGPPDRIAAATQAALGAISQYRTEAEIVAVAHAAAVAWDSQHHSTTKIGFWLWLKRSQGASSLLLIVSVLTIGLLVAYLKENSATIESDSATLEKGMLVDLAAIALLLVLYFFRRGR